MEPQQSGMPFLYCPMVNEFGQGRNYPNGLVERR